MLSDGKPHQPGVYKGLCLSAYHRMIDSLFPMAFVTVNRVYYHDNYNYDLSPEQFKTRLTYLCPDE